GQPSEAFLYAVLPVPRGKLQLRWKGAGGGSGVGKEPEGLQVSKELVAEALAGEGGFQLPAGACPSLPSRGSPELYSSLPSCGSPSSSPCSSATFWVKAQRSFRHLCLLCGSL
ncbi:Hypothetical predicted protein, partial [Marmota monax]